MWTLYKHINKINGKKYIGITSQKPQKRWGNNGKNYLRKNKNDYYQQRHFASAILKYGWNNFDHIIINSNLTKEQAKFAETQLIIFYQTTNPLYEYNISKGGDAHTDSEETKIRKSEAQKGKHHTEETKKKISKIKKGCKRSPEAIEKTANKNRGQKRTEETKKKMSEAQTGKHHSEESKIKMKETNKGKMPSREKMEQLWASNRGRKRTEEQKNNLKNGRRKYFKQVKNKETSEIFESITAAEKYYNIKNIARAIKNNYICGGYHWEYYLP